MITLLVLDTTRNCLHRPEDPPHCICRAARGHSGPHEYVPVDMAIIAARDAAELRLEPVLID